MPTTRRVVRTRVRKSVTVALRADRAVRLGIRLLLHGLLALPRGTRVRLTLRTPAGPWQEAGPENADAIVEAVAQLDGPSAGDSATGSDPADADANGSAREEVG